MAGDNCPVGGLLGVDGALGCPEVFEGVGKSGVLQRDSEMSGEEKGEEAVWHVHLSHKDSPLIVFSSSVPAPDLKAARLWRCKNSQRTTTSSSA